MSYRAVASGGPAGRGKCGSTEAVHFLRSRVQAARLQGGAGRSRVEVRQRILQRNDGCVRREPLLPACVIALALCPIPLCKYGVSGIPCVGGEASACVYTCTGVRGRHIYYNHSLPFFSETESLPEAGAHQSDYLTSGLQGSCACTSTPQH